MCKQVPQLVVFVLLPPAMVFGLVLSAPQLAASIRDFSAGLSSYAALIVALFAVIKLPSEFRDTRRRHAHEKAAEVAGQTIVATWQLTDRLIPFLFPRVGLTRPKDDAETPSALLWREFSERSSTIKVEYEAFLQAQRLAEAYLPHDAVAALRALSALIANVGSLNANFLLRVAQNDGIVPDDAFEPWSGAMKAASDEAVVLARTAVECLRNYTIGGTDWSA